MRLATVALVLLTSTAGATPLVSPRVRMVARGELAAGRLSDGIRADRALVTVRGGDADRLKRAGFDAWAIAPGVAAVRATAAELGRLRTQPGLTSIEERRMLHTLLDQAGPAVGAPQARAESGLDGTGVLVGVVDTGIDFHHPDLRTADGKTRIAALLDISQAWDGRHPELGMRPGRVFLREDIDAQLAADAAGMTPTLPIGEKDTNGHGTHVAAIATSNGLATGHGFPPGRYVGMAPGADLVIVQATNGGDSFSDANVLAGVTFTVDVAKLLGRPLALNLSLGGLGGAHDGTSNLETTIDELFPADTPGRVVVLACGNDGGRDLHAGAWSLDGEQRVPFQVPASTAQGGQAHLELWYTGTLSIAVESPDGTVTPAFAAGQSMTVDNPVEGSVTVDNDGVVQANGRRSAGVTITGASGAAPPGGSWKLRLSGKAPRWDAWVVDSPAGTFTHFTDRIAEDDRLALPSTARNAISVGSFGTRSSWVNLDGTKIERVVAIGLPSPFSSSGPTADGRFAPDLLAGGELVGAALSIDAQPDQPTSAFFVNGAPHYAWADDGVHGFLRGTSQASPAVAGAAALILQADPTLPASAVREVLRATARDDGAGFQPRSGFGKLDLVSATRYARGQRGQTVSPSRSSVGVSRDLLPPGDEQTVVTVTPRDASGLVLGPGHRVQVIASAGEPVGDVVDLGFGRYERAFAAHASRGAVGVISATVDDTPLDAHPQVAFVIDRSEVGRPFAGGGGACAQVGPQTSASGANARLGGALVLLISLIWMTNSLRRRRRTRL